MRKEKKKDLYTAAILLAAFALWTVSVRVVDVQPIGPEASVVGFAALNRFFHDFTGVHMSLYVITDWLSLLPIGFAAGFALLGLGQWIAGKSLRKVDRSILVLGGFYIAVMGAFCFFEMVPVNYRPILIDGNPEASYPSSTTMLVLCVMPTAAMQLNSRIGSKALRHLVSSAIAVFTACMVLGRLFSGVHWLSDIIGGILLSAGLVLMYRALCGTERK